MLFGYRQVPSGLAGTKIALDQIKSFYQKSLSQPHIRLFTIEILRQGSVDPRDFSAIADCVFQYIKQNIRFVYDPHNVETIQAPEVTIRFGYGDCDDQALLGAAMLASVGVPVQFRIIGRSEDRLEHIFIEAFYNNAWISFDPSECQESGDRLPFFPVEKIMQVAV